MKMMKQYEFECLICKKKCIKYRTIKVPIPRFCSTFCYRKASPSWINKTKLVWADASPEQKFEHIKKYYERNVIKRGSCWDWKRKCEGERYPRMHYSRSEPRITIHRASWLIHKGEIPERMFVLHKCDNTRCSNPEHLFLGNAKDNYQDAKYKRRHTHGIISGNAKLDNKKVKKIRELLIMGINMKKIAEKFNVSYYTIYRVKHNKSWQNI
jgi:hypothetical protein